MHLTGLAAIGVACGSDERFSRAGMKPDGRVAELITGNLPGHPVAAELKRLIE